MIVLRKLLDGRVSAILHKKVFLDSRFFQNTVFFMQILCW